MRQTKVYWRYQYGKAQDRTEKFPEIAAITAHLHPRRDIAVAIGRAIDPAGDRAERGRSGRGRCQA